VNIVSRTCRALLAALILSALGAHAAGVIYGGDPGFYCGAFSRGHCHIQLFTNALPEATVSIWPRHFIITNSLEVTSTAIFQTNRRVEVDFGDYGSYRGRLRKDHSVIVGRLRARNFPGVKNVNRVLRLHHGQRESEHGAVIQIGYPTPASTNVIPPSP
jgi:hypothetical protein